MRINLEIYKNRGPGQTVVLVQGGHGFRLSGIELLPGDPCIARCEFPVERLASSVTGLRYDPPKELPDGG